MVKKDTGVVTLPNGLKIQEELRDKLLARDWTKPQSKLDTRTIFQVTKDYERDQFSGFRVNEFTAEVELWVLGRIAVRKKCYDCARNPALLAQMHEEAFATNGTIAEIDLPQGVGRPH